MPLDDFREQRYILVKDSISELWRDARKNSDFLEYTSAFEPLLQDLGLRDHFTHSFNVFLLGYYIMNKLEELYPNDYLFCNIGNIEQNRNLIWMLTSTFHDVAYSLEKADQWLNKFFIQFLGVDPHLSLRMSELLTPVYIDFMHMLSQYHNNPSAPSLNIDFAKMDWLYYNALCEECARKNHGVLSALMLCYRMALKEGFLNRNTSGNSSIVNFFHLHLVASHAISLHNIRSIKVRFNEHPFAYLLVLCDELQDWGRDNDELEYCKSYLSNIRIRKNQNTSRIYIEAENQERIVNPIYGRLEESDLLKISINDWDILDIVKEQERRRQYANAIMKGIRKIPD